MRWIALAIVAVACASCKAAPSGKAENARAASETHFACNMDAFTPQERTEHAALSERLLKSVIKQHEMKTGYAFTVNASQMSAADLARWADLEKKCCPFLNFTIEMRRDNGPLSIALTGRTGVKAFLHEELGVK